MHVLGEEGQGNEVVVGAREVRRQHEGQAAQGTVDGNLAHEAVARGTQERLLCLYFLEVADAWE